MTQLEAQPSEPHPRELHPREPHPGEPLPGKPWPWRTTARRTAPWRSHWPAGCFPAGRCPAGSRWPRPVSSRPGWPAAGFPPTWPDRGFGEQVLRPWTVGYAPAGWRVLTAHLRDLGYGDAAIQAAGLARRTRRGALIDFFRDRAMFGIRWPDGTVAGFTGRARPGGGQAGPVYLNSRTTGLYRKGSLLVGLYEGRRVLAAGARPVLVEGPLDADRGERGRLIRGRLALRHRADPRPGHPARPDLRPAPGRCGRGLRRRPGGPAGGGARLSPAPRRDRPCRRRRPSGRSRTRPDSGASAAAGRWPDGSTPACPWSTWWSTRRWRRSNAGSRSPTGSSPRCTPPPRWSPGCRPARSRGRSSASPASSG
jgi:hypothetical protein